MNLIAITLASALGLSSGADLVTRDVELSLTKLKKGECKKAVLRIFDAAKPYQGTASFMEINQFLMTLQAGKFLCIRSAEVGEDKTWIETVNKLNSIADKLESNYEQRT